LVWFSMTMPSQFVVVWRVNFFDLSCASYNSFNNFSFWIMDFLAMLCIPHAHFNASIFVMRAPSCGCIVSSIPFSYSNRLSCSILRALISKFLCLIFAFAFVMIS
jgi:hypothetical protein